MKAQSVGVSNVYQRALQQVGAQHSTLVFTDDDDRLPRHGDLPKIRRGVAATAINTLDHFTP